MRQQWALRDDEVIDRNLLAGLAILAKANSRSVVDELNIALSSYVMENLPQRLCGDNFSPAQARDVEEPLLSQRMSSS
jgi:hypothetical protein